MRISFLKICLTYLTLAFTGLVQPVLAEHPDEGRWYVRATTGLSWVDDTQASSQGVGTVDGTATIDVDAGFLAGMAVGFNYNSNWSAELVWEYRTNDSTTALADGARFTEGNYASNSFYANGVYSFRQSEPWSTYVGAGLGWLQEIDLDLEDSSGEQSFSGDGDIGWQLMAGVHYSFDPSWQLNAGVRYGDFGKVNLKAETSAAGEFQSIEYAAFTLDLGVAYLF